MESTEQDVRGSNRAGSVVIGVRNPEAIMPSANLIAVVVP
jgi:hypothetical protein